MVSRFIFLIIFMAKKNSKSVLDDLNKKDKSEC